MDHCRGLRGLRGMRLARFNVESGEDDDHMHFSGLPSPAGAAAIASFAILFYTLRKEDNPLIYAATIDVTLQMILPFFGVIVALLMVSRIPYPHVVNQVFRVQKSFSHIVGLLFALVAVMVIRAIRCRSSAARSCWSARSVFLAEGLHASRAPFLAGG